MKKIDIKSLLIGILLGTNLMFLFGAKTMDCDDNYYEIRKVKRAVEGIKQDTNWIRIYGVDCN